MAPGLSCQPLSTEPGYTLFMPMGSPSTFRGFDGPILASPYTERRQVLVDVESYPCYSI